MQIESQQLSLTVANFPERGGFSKYTPCKRLQRKLHKKIRISNKQFRKITVYDLLISLLVPELKRLVPDQKVVKNSVKINQNQQNC